MVFQIYIFDIIPLSLLNLRGRLIKIQPFKYSWLLNKLIFAFFWHSFLNFLQIIYGISTFLIFFSWSLFCFHLIIFNFLYFFNLSIFIFVFFDVLGQIFLIRLLWLFLKRDGLTLKIVFFIFFSFSNMGFLVCTWIFIVISGLMEEIF